MHNIFMHQNKANRTPKASKHVSLKNETESNFWQDSGSEAVKLLHIILSELSRNE
jgi:hypothetical protein